MQTLFVGTANGLAIYNQIGPDEWQRGVHVLLGQAIRAIVATDAETLLVSADGGVAQESFDGGTNWRTAGGPGPAPIGLDVATADGSAALTNPRLQAATAYARLGGRKAVLLGAGAGGLMLFRSLDNGVHWEPAGMPGAPSGRITTILPNGNGAWAGGDDGRLLRSTDLGSNWRELAREPAAILCLAMAAR